MHKQFVKGQAVTIDFEHYRNWFKANVRGGTYWTWIEDEQFIIHDTYEYYGEKFVTVKGSGVGFGLPAEFVTAKEVQ